MTIAELNLTITTASQAITATTSQFVPQGVSYAQFVNNNATGTVTFSLNTPATNGIGITLQPGGSTTIACPPGVIYPLASVKIIGSASAVVTVLYSA